MKNALNWLELAAVLGLWGCFLWKLNHALAWPYGFALVVVSAWLIGRALKRK